MAGKKTKTRRKRVEEIIEIPEGVEVKIEKDMIIASKGGDEIKRRLGYDAKIKDGKIILECEKPTKRDKKLIKTNTAHIRNMVAGLQEKFVYKLQICSVHFPMNVAVQGNEVVIKNFLGETKERKAKILDGVEVKIDGEIINVESCDKEKAGQTAANIEKATRIKKRDKRVFQDGIYITEKQKGAKRK